MAGCAAGQWRYAELGVAVTLSAGTAYYVVSAEVAGGDAWHDYAGTALTTTGAAAVNSGIFSGNGMNWIPAGGAGNSYVPVSFRYGVGGGGGTNVQWLVSDQLGTPRMVIDQSGSLSGVKRHDYLPFGEEIGAEICGRTTNQGYGQFDGVRQGFTGYEKDAETGLNYAQARYYANGQGRFTSTDPYNIVMETQIASDKEDAQKQLVSYLSNPQRWNRYHYALNNPLLYTDPNGEDVTIYYRPSGTSNENGVDLGHFFIYVRNDETGEGAYFDYYPQDGTTRLGEVNQDRLDAHASLTFETNATQEQAMLDGIKEAQQGVPNYDWLPNLDGSRTYQCTNMSAAILDRGGISVGDPSRALTPADAWDSAFRQFGEKSKEERGGGYYSQHSRGRVYVEPFSLPPHPGKEYGRDPRGQARQVDGNAINNRTLMFRNGKRLN